MGVTFEPRKTFTGYKHEELWVQTLDTGEFEVGVRLDKRQYTFLTLTRSELEAFRTSLDAALLEALP